jgi:serine/threonine protein kinase
MSWNDLIVAACTACRLVIHHALNHPNIVKMRDVILEPNHLNIVMECVEGQNLFMHLKALPAKYSEDDARWADM